MHPERWQQIDQLFHLALAQEPNRRAGFLAQACAGDDSLRSQVEALISSHEQPSSFVETLVADVAAGFLAQSDAKLAPGTIVGHYKILSLLGEGGMGQVFLAEDTRLHRRIALKLLPSHFTRNSDRVRRFEQEACAASALNHPNILTIHEIGQLDYTHFIVTEFIDGQTLRQALIREKMKLTDALDVAIQVASALDAAHTAGIVHRDIKPENIMLRRDGYVKILDFGLAKLAEDQVSTTDPEPATRSLFESMPGAVMGTVTYMSPEQARGLGVDARTDIWSLGVVLYELAAGRVPFQGATATDVILSIVEKDPASLTRSAPEAPAELERIVNKALSKNREERYQTVNDLSLDLKRLKEETESEARLERSALSASKSNAARNETRQPELATINESAAATADVGVHPTSSAEYIFSEIKSHKRIVAFAAAAMVIIAVAAVAYFLYLGRSARFAASREAIDSVAVLPFVNVSNDPTVDYLSDGISDSIITGLSRLPTLKVRSLNSVLRYKGKETDLQAVGRQLKIRAVLMGRLTQQGDNLVISTELVDVRDNSRLWGEQYNRKLADVLSLQEEISQRISEKLRLRLSGQEKKQIAKRYTDNPEAYLLYQQGREYFRRRTREGTEKGIACFEEAIKKDPAYALARVWLATAYSDVSSPLPFKEVRKKVESLLLKAIELDNDLAEAHAQLGGIRQDDGDWVAAERECKRAVELDPSSVFAHTFYASYLNRMGRHDEAIAEAKQKQELEPLSVSVQADLGHMLYFARRYDEAIEQFKKAIDMDPKFAPAHARLGITYLQKGMNGEAILELEKARAFDDSPERPGRFAWPAYAYAVLGQRDKAKQMLTELKEQAKQRHIPPINFATIYTGLGEKDQAFAWLEKVYEEHGGRELGEVRVNPMFDSLRSDPRFASLLRRVNLEP
jgi:serine/threonine-protein kinase